MVWPAAVQKGSHKINPPTKIYPRKAEGNDLCRIQFMQFILQVLNEHKLPLCQCPSASFAEYSAAECREQ